MTMNTFQDESVRDHNAGMGNSVDHPSEDYPKAFRDITTEICSTVDHLLQLYQKRSQISISHAKFQAAFRDADTMCSIDPQSPLGYLSSSNHRSYSALAKSKEAATLQQAKRVDFITQLPLEVVSQFIVPVILKYQPSSMYKQWQYLGVSHAWRYRLLQPSPLHYEVQEPYQARVAHVNELDKYKDYVRSVTVYRFRGGDDSAQAFPWQDSKSLRRLQLFDDFFGRGDQPSNVKSIIMAVGDRLTHLDLGVDDQHGLPSSNTIPPIRLEQILEYAPHLRMLTIANVIANEWNSHNTYRNLVCLSIHVPPHTMTHDMVIDVLDRCPSLRALSMFRCDQSYPLRVIHERCPLLSYLRYGPLLGESDHDYVDFDSYDFASSNTIPGLKKLTLVADYSTYDISDVISLLKQHHATLEEIRISVTVDTTTAYERDLKITFPKLQSLHLDGSCDESSHLYRWIINRAPSLTSLNLDISPIDINEPVPNHATALTMTVENNRHIGFLHGFISRHMERLKHLTLIFKCTNLMLLLIEHIGELEHLDTLAIEVWDELVDNEIFDIILDNIASRDQSLSRFTWKGRESTLDFVLSHLRRMNHIKHLTLGHELTESDLQQVLRLCKPRKSLTLHCSDDVSGDMIEKVEDHFRGILLYMHFVTE